MNNYDVGDTIQINGLFTDSLGAPSDPATIFGEFTDPSGNITSYQFGVDVELVKDAVGDYHFDVLIDEAGVWNYRMYSTGSGATAAFGYFFAASAFAPPTGITLARAIP